MTALAEVAAIPAALKIPPQALEAEQSLLGGLLLDNRKWDEVSAEISAASFYNQNHRLIFETIGALQQADDPADIVTVAESLDKAGNLDKAGGLAYINTLANNTPSTANIATYARIVRERAILRDLIRAANDIATSAYHPQGKPAREVLDRAEQVVLEISNRDGHKSEEFASLSDLLQVSVERIEFLFNNPDHVTGVSTGFTDIDEKTAGLQRGDLIITAGRPSMGKTAFALNIAEYIAVEKKLPVAVFSLEMSGEQLAMRLLSSVGQIESGHIRTGRLGDADWSRLGSAMGLLAKAPIFVDTAGSLSPMDLRSRARRLAHKEGQLGLIIVDYIQLMESTQPTETRATEIAGITRALKMLAKELDVPVMALSQLNRELERRPDKRPVMADLRESGAIEQDADVIFFIYRGEVYDDDKSEPGVAEIIIGKQRNGPIGTTKLTFRGQYTRFENYAAATADYAQLPPGVGGGGGGYDGDFGADLDDNAP